MEIPEVCGRIEGNCPPCEQSLLKEMESISALTSLVSYFLLLSHSKREQKRALEIKTSTRFSDKKSETNRSV